MKVKTGDLARETIQAFRNSEPKRGYYDYYSNGIGAVIRIKDKKCIFFNTSKIFALAIEGSLDEFIALKNLNIKEMEAMIEWARKL